MKILHNQDKPVLAWEDCLSGEVYQSVDDARLVVLKSESAQGFCLRTGAGMPTNRIWVPGPESKWVWVDAELHLKGGIL